jgi:zinc protease
MAVARDAMRALLYPGHAYGRNVIGTPDSVAAIQPKEIEEHWQQAFYQKGTLFALSGDLDETTWTSSIESTLQALAQRPAPPEPKPRKFKLEKSVRREVIMDKAQAVLQIAFPTGPLTQSTQPALDLLNEALSDLGSRLFIRIREELGLAYFVGSSQFLGLEAGHFVFYLGTDPAKRHDVEKAFLHEIQHIGSTGISSAELERARAKIISEDKIAAQHIAGTVYQAALHELYGQGWGYREERLKRIGEVTLDEVNAAAKLYFDSKPHALVVVSPQ